MKGNTQYLRLCATMVFGVSLSIWPDLVVAHEVLIQPILQSATPTSIWIQWETSGGEETRVDWGRTAALGMTQTGTKKNLLLGSRVHEVPLENLEPNTKYFYRVVTEDAMSDVFHFITPPLPSDEASFRLVAMSDMQIDRSNPDVFRRIIHEGVIDYVQTNHGSDLAAELGLMLIPGDLVENGLVINQWRDEFFAPAADLLKYVPVYPVLGNHENNSPFYFDYFHLPQNGSPGKEEHWWYTDYSNLRLIGLDSNALYRSDEQINWLDTVLAQACAQDDIDFVFAELHHPHKSELWIAGEIDFTGRVIERLENFTAMCGKPSIHFFGHTHGYSRGQSKDHNHLWVNVATAGGNIDYWGEYAQVDYDEFSVSHDEWGFVMVEVEAGPSPQFILRRLSFGNENQSLVNAVKDTVTIRRYNNLPERPVPLIPVSEGVNPSCFTLQASAFFDSDQDLHGASQWQLSRSCQDFSRPIMDQWVQHENWYGGVDTQAGDELFDHVVRDLQASTRYCWRVRYRDRSLAWSPWSAPQAFETGVSTTSENMVINPGAETGTTGWTAELGHLESLSNGQCDGVLPHSGAKYFAVGGVCNPGVDGRATQVIDLSSYIPQIQTTTVVLAYSAYLRNFSGSDRPSFEVVVYDVSASEVARSMRLDTLSAQWTKLSGRLVLPSSASRVAVFLRGEHNAGSDNDAYFDDIDLRLHFGGESSDCDEGLPPKPPPMDAGFSDSADAMQMIDVGVVMDASDPLDAGFRVSMDAMLAAVDAENRRPAPKPEPACSCQSTRFGSRSLGWTMLLFLLSLLSLVIGRRRSKAPSNL